MEEQCKLVLARSKRDREMDPAKQGTAKQLDVLESAQLHLKKAKKSLQAVRMQVPKTDDNNVMLEPIQMEQRFMTEFSEVEEAMDSLEKGLKVLELRESILLVIFNSDSHKQAYAAIEASDLAEGGGSLGHLDAARKKLIMDIVAKGNEKNDKLRKEEREKEGKASKAGKGYQGGYQGGYRKAYSPPRNDYRSVPPPPPPQSGRNSVSVDGPRSGTAERVPYAPNNPGFGTNICYHCGGMGHFSRECPAKKGHGAQES
jgi:hypothetical protein